MTLLELMKAVKEERLDMNQLEGYRDQLSSLYAEMKVELAEKEKEEARFLVSREENESVASAKVRWKATDSGQRLITLKRYCEGTAKLLDSLKGRIYSHIS